MALDNDINIDTMKDVKTEKIIARMKADPQGTSFAEACRVCDHYFGKPRQQGTSHRIYRMPWPGDPRVNIQNDKGKAKVYQVRQILKAVERLHYESNKQ